MSKTLNMRMSGPEFWNVANGVFISLGLCGCSGELTRAFSALHGQHKNDTYMIRC